MNTLTKNRILQQGDEYRQNGEWKPVPKDNFGLQVMFTPYKECRRPSEKPQVLKAIPISPRPIGRSKDSRPVPTARKVQTSEGAKCEASTGTIGNDAPRSGESISKISQPESKTVTPEAERDKSPVPSPSGTGDASYLPTVVSTKAHKAAYDHKGEAPFPPLGETPETANCRTEVPKRVASPTPLKREVVFGHTDPPCIWIGRNGTFGQQGVNLYAHNDGRVIKVVPVGKRGVAKNAQIEFPKSAIPTIIDFLQKQL